MTDHERSTVDPTPRDQFDTDSELGQLNKRGWTITAVGQRHSPDGIIAHQVRGDHVDVLIIAGEGECGAYRAPLPASREPLDVEHVRWYLAGDATDVLRHLLALGPVDTSAPLAPLDPRLRAALAEVRRFRRTIRIPQ